MAHTHWTASNKDGNFKRQIEVGWPLGLYNTVPRRPVNTRQDICSKPKSSLLRALLCCLEGVKGEPEMLWSVQQSNVNNPPLPEFFNTDWLQNSVIERVMWHREKHKGQVRNHLKVGTSFLMENTMESQGPQLLSCICAWFLKCCSDCVQISVTDTLVLCTGQQINRPGAEIGPDFRPDF